METIAYALLWVAGALSLSRRRPTPPDGPVVNAFVATAGDLPGPDAGSTDIFKG